MDEKNRKFYVTTSGVVIAAISWWAGCIDCAVLIITGVFVFDVLIKQRKKSS